MWKADKAEVDGVHYFVVTNYVDLVEKVFPFFKRFPFFNSNLKSETRVVQTNSNDRISGEHLAREGFVEIVDTCEKTERRKEREILENHDASFVIKICEYPQRLYVELCKSRDDIVQHLQ